jgi:hypothetical protein
MKLKVLILLPLLTSPAFADEAARLAALDLIREALEGHRQMYEQVEGVEATISISSDDLSKDRQLAALLMKFPEKYRDGFRAQAPPIDEDGMSTTEFRTRWESQVLWDRATKNAVVFTTRESHVVNGSEKIKKVHPVIYYRLDGQDRAKYSKVEESPNDPDSFEIDVWSDIGRVRDMTVIAAINDRRYDEFLEWTRDASLNTEVASSVQPEIIDSGSSVTLVLKHLSQAGDEDSTQRFTFSRLPFGLALSHSNYSPAGSNYNADTYIDYWTFETPNGPTLLPGRRLSTSSSQGPDGEMRETLEEVRLQLLKIRPTGIDAETMKREVSVRVGTMDGEIVHELVASPPRHVGAPSPDDIPAEMRDPE